MEKNKYARSKKCFNKKKIKDLLKRKKLNKESVGKNKNHQKKGIKKVKKGKTM